MSSTPNLNWARRFAQPCDQRSTISLHGLNDVKEFLSAGESQEVAEDVVRSVRARLACPGGEVWRDDDPVHLQQWIVGGDRFWIGDVETGSGDATPPAGCG